jgi:small subunit ribosomal protein S15
MGKHRRKMDKQSKAEIIEKHGGSGTNTGSPVVQVAILSAKIKELTEHLKVNKKDNHSRRGLIAMVNKRRKLLKYLKREDLQAYESITDELGIRKK